MKRALPIAAAVVALALPAAALADPCEADVRSLEYGQTISGPVRYIVDGDGLCVGRSTDPNTWVGVRLTDFYAPELSEPGGVAAKAAMERITRGRAVECLVGGDHGRTYSYDRALASCSIDGRSLADLMRATGVREGGRGR